MAQSKVWGEGPRQFIHFLDFECCLYPENYPAPTVDVHSKSTPLRALCSISVIKSNAPKAAAANY